MQIGDMVRKPLEAVGKQVGKAFGGIKRFIVLERVLAIVLVGNPLVMYLFDEITVGTESGFRDSISAYYDMEAAAAFYVPLTVAAMLLVVSGVIKDGNWHNWVLGVLLALVVVLNKDGFGWVHYPAALGFYGGNAVAIGLTRASWWRKGSLLAAGGLTLLWYLVFRNSVDISLLIAEWLGLAIIAVHYFFDAAEGMEYQAPRPPGAPDKRAFATAE